jgi:hypothetical protein
MINSLAKEIGISWIQRPKKPLGFLGCSEIIYISDIVFNLLALKNFIFLGFLLIVFRINANALIF